MQLKLFSDKVLEDMVNDGRYFMAKRFLELKRVYPCLGCEFFGYVDKLWEYDVGRGFFDRGLSKDLSKCFEVKYLLGEGGFGG